MADLTGQASQYLAMAQQASQQGEGYLQQGISDMQKYVSPYQSVYGDISRQIAGLTGDGSNRNQIMELAGKLSPWAQTLADMGTGLYGQGQTLYNSGLGILGTGRSILDMDAGAGGLAGEYINAIKAFNPDRYVSMAASDVQSAYGNVLGQMERQSARQGLSGGASQAQQQDYIRNLATALSGAKTRARMQGLDEQKKALSEALQLGAQTAQTGSQIASAGGSMQAQGMQGVDWAGRMTADQANIYSNLDANAQKAIQLAMDNAMNLSGLSWQQQSAILNGQLTAAEYYSQQAQGWASVAGLFASQQQQSQPYYYSSGTIVNHIPADLEPLRDSKGREYGTAERFS